MNRLAKEKSPYLLQHKNNPVDWYPWGPEAFEKAKREDKPIFLSIGYSTCHWCHVMEHESFEDAQVAAIMNQAFVNIKVDREERPDIDHIYMGVCQAMTGSGGWPLTLVLTPDQRPFFAGTYFPKESRFGRPGMLELVPRLEEVWKTQREKVESSAQQILEFISSAKVGSSERLDIGEVEIKNSLAELKGNFDDVNGGFGDAPKFPSPHNLMFLLRGWKRFQDSSSLKMATQTLKAMRAGGLYDQVGFGFHRYSVDAHWLVPHFEKMLYDQALLAFAYLEAHQATGESELAQTAHEIFEYVLRDLQAPGGGFYSAEDADSEGHEGKFYVWSYEELQAELNPDELIFLEKYFGVLPDGNFVDMGQPSPENILHQKHKIPDEVEWATLRKKLFEMRARRVRPHLDDKILADWNGLMIAALAKGVQVLEDEGGRYLKAAQGAFDFIFTQMKIENSSGVRLYHRFREGEKAVEGNADDYAYLMWAALELYGATFESRYLRAAKDLADRLIEDFWDENGGGLLFTSRFGEKLILRKKETYDGATPSANAVCIWSFLRLARLTGDDVLERRAHDISNSFAREIREHPTAHNMSLLGLDFGLGPSSEVVVVGSGFDAKGYLQALMFKFSPHTVVLFKPVDHDDEIVKLAPFVEPLRGNASESTIFVCRNFSCQRPTTDLAEALEQI